MPFCTACGKQNPDDARFCSQCGTRLVVAGPATGEPSGEATATIQIGPGADKVETSDRAAQPGRRRRGRRAARGARAARRTDGARVRAAASCSTRTS